VLGYLWPALVDGKILSPAAVLYGFPPWQLLGPPDLFAHLNTLLIDPPVADLPWRALVRELLHSGTFPAWNPHVLTGVSLFANPQTGLFSIFSLPLWLLPLDQAVGVEAAWKLWAAAFGMYMLARQLRLSFLPGLLAGVGFSFSALNIVWLTHETLPAVAALLPWMIWLVERIFQSARPLDALGLAVATALALGGGHPGMQVHVVLAAGLYALLRLGMAQGDEGSHRARSAALAAGGLGLGVALMAFMLVPEVLSGRDTVGIAARRSGGTLPGSQLGFSAIRTVAFPDWWGRPSAFEAPAGGPVGAVGNYNERTLYAGTVTLLLGLFGFLVPRRRRIALPFAALAVLGLAIPLRAAGFVWFATHVPPLDLVQSQRLHFLYAFGIAIGAALGLQAVLDRPRDAHKAALVPLAALGLATVAWMTAGANPADAGRVLRHFATGADFPLPGVLALTSVVWFALLALGVGAALLAIARRPRRRSVIASLVVLLAVADAYHFAHGYQPMASARTLTPPLTSALRYLQRHAHEGRIVGLGAMLPPERPTLYGLDDIRGYDPPQPTLRYFRLWRVANPEQVDWRPLLLPALGSDALKVVSVLGARFVVADASVANLPVDEPTLRPLERVYHCPDATVFVNPNAVPRALVPSGVITTRDDDETRLALVAPGFDPRRTAVVERDQPGTAALATGPPVHGRVKVTADANAHVRLTATLGRRGLVVLNDALAPGWSVSVDRRPARALRVNDVMRGVLVGPGRHEIAWRYAVPGLRTGAVVSLVSAAVFACFAAWLASRRRSVIRRTRRY